MGGGRDEWRAMEAGMRLKKKSVSTSIDLSVCVSPTKDLL